LLAAASTIRPVQSGPPTGGVRADHFHQMRIFAGDLLRLVIETRKDRMGRLR
jgi:hypothetical protein